MDSANMINYITNCERVISGDDIRDMAYFSVNMANDILGDDSSSDEFYDLSTSIIHALKSGCIIILEES